MMMLPYSPRWPRGIAYFLFALGGYFTMAFPSVAVQAVATPWMAMAWGIFLLFGGAVSFVGLLGRNWWGEMVGLPLVSAANFFYGAVVLLSFNFMRDGAYLFVGTFYLAIGFLLLDRWLRIYRLSKIRVPERPDGQSE